MKKLFFALSLTASLMVSCDDHFDLQDTSMKVGDILCADGDILRFEDFSGSGKEPVGIVFYVNHDETVEGLGYAVYLFDLAPAAMSDTCGISQKTSADVDALDGNGNTFALMNSQNAGSPLAEAVFDLWRYGQSAYIPSVAQYRHLYSHRGIVNSMLQRCRGDLLEEKADGCWYWSSTEVEGQSSQKAWLFSMQSGAIQETPKIQNHKSRAIITINK